jgi:hypothetical protein
MSDGQTPLIVGDIVRLKLGERLVTIASIEPNGRITLAEISHRTFPSSWFVKIRSGEGDRG